MAVTALDKDARAHALGGRRDELLARLPRKVPAAGGLAHQDQELVVDEAIEFTVLEHSEPIATVEDLERVYWAAAAIHVKRALEGRHDTVRAGYRRVSDDALAELAGGADDDPAAIVEDAEERRVLLDCAAALAEDQQRLLRLKWLGGTKEPLGYRQIARALGITIAAAKRLDEAIKRRVEEFAAVYAAGELCQSRELQISSVAESAASPRQVQLAHAHIAHCATCRGAYAAQLRAAAFERKLTALLPPVVDEPTRSRLRGAWDAVTDTLTRPFSQEPAATAAQLASSGVGRGAGTIALLKIAGACLASAGAAGVCATTLVVPALNDDRRAKAEPKPAAKRASGQERVGNHTRLPSRAELQLTPTPTPSPKPKPKRAARETRGGTGPTDHEDRAPASPAPANAAPGGESEFDPTYQPSSPPQPAPAPAAPGATEFF